MTSGEGLPSSSASTSSRDRLRGVIAIGMLYDWTEKLQYCMRSETLKVCARRAWPTSVQML